MLCLRCKRIMHRSWSKTRPQSSCSRTAGQVDSKDVPTHTSLNAEVAWQPKAAEGGVLVSCSADRDKKNSESKGKHC
ncbi:hypothetical protein D8674_013099 [Pyrus ussuriensis x Pyrus communis]|uniref:Uncharacterized protein n=1 Tax=Pyrus ussuriensis x Pyrus communis TaxID=2448454 RepID=A0A5N5GVP8_9ROSA|nr:hypothetical protein D8674_013099 [Pyrus ussuriensis x Pyrus communis]